MDLRKIVEEVEHRKREDYALLAPERPTSAPASGRGVAGSILHSVRERMLRENPTANVAAIARVIEPDRASQDTIPTNAMVSSESTVVAIAREAAKTSAREAPSEKRRVHAKDDFLARYLLMSEEFERRFGVKGWTELVRKRSSANLRQ